MKESEWITRKTRINTRLTSLNPSWTIIPYTEGMDITRLNAHAIEEYPTANGPADYALVVKGKLLGILEAKKVSIGAQNVLEQAKRYAAGCKKTIGSWNDFKAPFLYASNGVEIHFADVREDGYYSRELLDFHTPDAMEELFNRDYNSAREWLNSTPNEIERLRPYQKDAIKAFEIGLLEKKQRMMLAMASGTGKTFTAVSMIYRLLKSGYAKRILFLVTGPWKQAGDRIEAEPFIFSKQKEGTPSFFEIIFYLYDKNRENVKCRYGFSVDKQFEKEKIPLNFGPISDTP